MLGPMLTFLVLSQSISAQNFVTVSNQDLVLDGRQYSFVGTNYWYGSLLALEKDKKRGIDRLRRELDILKANEVTNIRLLAGAEGTGKLNGVERVGPALQPIQGKFNSKVLHGLDVILAEMASRDMKAVIFFSNNWEWSGGWQQYLIWNKVIDKKWLTEKPDWETLRDLTAKFYSCQKCIDSYHKQIRFVMARRNKINGVRYVDDPTIMAWEIANEPRPMRPAANEAYAKFIAKTAALIRSLDRKHLITTGHEGRIGTESTELFERVHSDPNIDYLTIHIWPKNWGWLGNGNLADSLQNAIDKTTSYIAESSASARKLNKPLVIEEFGMPRDDLGFSTASTTKFRDRYYSEVFFFLGRQGGVAGANFWAFGGTARPQANQTFWKKGDELMGDPPMEEQGLNTVFDSDVSTFKVIRRAAEQVKMFTRRKKATNK